MSGYPRDIGIEIAVRTLGAEVIICDEIGSMADARATLGAANCGVPLIASAHASSVEELLERPAIVLLHRARVFGSYIGLSRRTAGGFDYSVTSRQEL
jgi:stage III sporulation protein AA